MNLQFPKYSPEEIAKENNALPLDSGNGNCTKFSPTNNPDVTNNIFQEILYLSIRFSPTFTIPLSINSMSPANQIIEILIDSIPFENKPLMLHKGKILEPLISLKAQNIQNKDEIVIYEKKLAQILNSQNNPNPFNNNFLNVLHKSEASCADFQAAPFEQKIFGILNEVNRLEDLASNMENLELGTPLILDSDSDDEIDDFESEDFLTEDENDFVSPPIDTNNCSLSAILNPVQVNKSPLPPPKIMKTKILTVLGPQPENISSQPLPTCFQSVHKIPNKNNPVINCPSFKSFEDASRFFANNSSTYWKW